MAKINMSKILTVITEPVSDKWLVCITYLKSSDADL